MSPDRARVLREERGAVLDLCRTLTPEEWATPSDCAGWSVQDVVAHMGAAFHGMFTPWLLRVMRTTSIERSNDGDVESRRWWEPDRVLREYESWGGRVLGLMPLMQRRPLRAVPIPLGDIGKYPMGLLASALTFDHHVHLRHDIAVPLGRTLPPPSAEHMAVVSEWLLAGMPQMCGEALSWVDRPLALVLTGPGGGAWTIGPLAGKGLQVQEGRSPAAAATVTGDVYDFPIWGTKRRPWHAFGLAIEDDEEHATRFLDSLNLV
ncbi:MAG TPA: maleylpyruvate isomerase family mycothiol-dependent enzyme [Candidatus Dormibacteraeota bacterium]